MARAQRFDLSSETAQSNFLQFVGQMRLAGKRPVFELVPEKRSLDQNDMIHALYQQIASQKQDETFREIRAHCKLHHGVPILRRDSEQFRVKYDRLVKPRFEYQEKLDLMDWFPVTSLMSKTQGTEYIDTLIREFSKQGVSLIHPSEAESYA